MRLALSLFALALVGCATPKDRTRIVKFDSEPRGARVFVGYGANEGDAKKTRHFLGVTPFDWKTEGDDEGRFRLDGAFIYSFMVPPAAVFFADPPSGQTNLHSKQQVFHSGTTFVSPDRIPEGVFFDLTKP